MGYTKVGPSPIVNFTSEYAKPLVSLKTNIVARGGGGTPTAPIAITGFSEVNVTRAGVNLWDEEWESGGYNNTTGEKTVGSTQIRSKNKIRVVSGQTHYMRFNSSALVVLAYDANGDFISVLKSFTSSGTFTTPATVKYVTFYLVGTTYNNDISLNYPASYTDYIAHNINTFTLNLGQTVYGGYVDWENGKGYITYKKIVLDGTQDISNVNWRPKTNSVGWLYSAILTDVKKPLAAEVPSNLSDKLAVVSYNQAYDNDIDCFAIVPSGNQNLAVRVKDTSLTTKGAINTWLAQNNIEIVYELATPIEISLPTTMPQTIQGVQNWFADSGDIELCYTSFIEYHKVASIFVTPNSNVQIESAEGAIANFTTPLAMPLVALKTAIVAQGGGGTPTTPIPIVGVSEVNATRAGVNIFGGEVLADTIVSKVANATKDTENKTVSYLASNVTTVVLFDKFNANTQYTFYLSATSNVTNLIIEYTDGTKTPATGSIEPNTFVTSTAGKSIKSLKGIYHTGTSTLKYDECGIFLGTVNSFTPYNADTFTLNLGQTVYGGYVDWKNGKLVVTHGYITFDGSIDELWIYYSNNDGFYLSIDDMKSGQNLNGLCSHFPIETAFSRFGVRLGNNNTRAYFNQIPSNISGVTSDVDTWRTWLFNNPVSLVYPLATPIEIDLATTMPSTIEGVQNWFADSGDIELEYKKIIT